MCINCYHRRGRTKKAWACSHDDRLHYSKGLCQNCYLAKYYRNRKEKKTKKPAKKAGKNNSSNSNSDSGDESIVSADADS
jgi:hypothetical protein